MTPVTDILARNRDLALSSAEVADKNGLLSEMNRSYGMAFAYAESIRIIEAAAKPEPVHPAPDVFRCAHPYRDGTLETICGQPANYTFTPAGSSESLRRCADHVPDDVLLTISEHDDQRDRA